jgi:hypothetical protein
MKKLLVAAVAAAFLLCSTAPLSAAELSSYGFMKVVPQFTDNYGYIEDGQGTNDFAVNQRARTFFDFTANEYLKATIGLEWDSAWGNSDGEAGRNDGLALMGDQNMIETKHLYMDFTFPGTEVAARAGQSWIELPSNFGSSILGGDMPAISLNMPINDQLGMTLGWARTYDLNGGFGETKDESGGDDNDILFATLPMNMDGFSLTPFGAYGFLGDGDTFADEGQAIGYGTASSLSGFGGNSLAPFGDDIDAWWLGLSGDVTMMDPIVFLYDVNYGEIDGDDAESSGYVADFAIQYKMDRMTPQIMAYYGSGDDWGDYNSDKPEGKRMPVYFTESFGPTGLGYSNCFGCAGPIADGQFSYYQAGMWAVGLSLQDIVLTDKLTGALQLFYNEGTNDKEMAENGVYTSPAGNRFTEKDSAVEVGAQIDYAMYENLTATLDAGYIAMDLDEDVWNKKFEEEVTRVVMGLTYSW